MKCHKKWKVKRMESVLKLTDAIRMIGIHGNVRFMLRNQVKGRKESEGSHEVYSQDNGTKVE